MVNSAQGQRRNEVIRLPEEIIIGKVIESDALTSCADVTHSLMRLDCGTHNASL